MASRWYVPAHWFSRAANKQETVGFVCSQLRRPPGQDTVGTCGDNMWTRHMCHASSTDNARGHMCAIRGEGMRAHNVQKHIW